MVEQLSEDEVVGARTANMKHKKAFVRRLVVEREKDDSYEVLEPVENGGKVGARQMPKRSKVAEFVARAMDVVKVQEAEASEPSRRAMLIVTPGNVAKSAACVVGEEGNEETTGDDA